MAAVRGWGRVGRVRREFDEAREHAEDLAKQGGARLVSSGDEPELVAGVATAYLEIFEREPDLDAVFVPIGGGSGARVRACGAAALAPNCQIIGVQSAASPAAHDSWQAGELVRRPNRTKAEGLSTGFGFELPQQILRERLADFMLVNDDRSSTRSGC